MTETNIKSKFAKTNIDWETPYKLFQKLDDEFHFTIDLAADNKNKKIKKYFSKEEDSLKQDWTGEVGFLNPPFNEENFAWENWLAKAHESTRLPGTTVVCLIPVRTNVKWWKICMKAKEIRFIEGRLRFEGARWALPQSMSLVIFEHTNEPCKYTTMKP